MFNTHDALGRAFPNQSVFNDDPHTITDADLYAGLETTNIHGPLYTPYLAEFYSFYIAREKYINERIGWLTRSNNLRYGGEIGGPVLYNPADQFPHDKWGTPLRPSRRMTLLRDLTARGESILKHAGRYHLIPHGGWDKHQIANACNSASLHLGVLHDGKPFKAPDLIAGGKGVRVAYEIKGEPYESTYRPDFRFGADRYFIVETDLGNEVGHATDPKVRKTYERMVLEIMTLIGTGLYHEAYGIPADKALLALIISTSETKFDLIHSIIFEHTQHIRRPGPGCNFILTKHVPATAYSASHSPKPIDLWNTPWKRAGRPDFYINDPGRQ